MIYKKNDKIVKTPQFARLVNYFEGLNQEWDEVNDSSSREYECQNVGNHSISHDRFPQNPV